MRVAIVTHYWKNSPGGGVKTFLVNLYEALRDKGVDVRVVFKEGEDRENVKVQGSRFLFPFRAFFKLFKLKPDVVHSHGTWYCLLAGVIYKKFRGVRLVHTFHTEPTEKEKLNLFARFFMQYLINNADCVTFVSARLKEKIEEIYGLRFGRTAVTHAGIRAVKIGDEEINAFRAKFGIRPESFVLLALGLTALEAKAKGLKLLIQSLKKVRQIHPNIQLIATREGKYASEVKNFAKEIGMDDIVVFTGDIESPMVAVAVCDIYAHIVFGEGGLSLSILEAMAMGKPIIASRVGGIPEAIQHEYNGLLVDNEENEICDAIIRMMRNKEFAERCGRNAQKTVKEKFSLEAMSFEFLRIYQ